MVLALGLERQPKEGFVKMKWQFHFAVLLVTLAMLIWLPLILVAVMALAALIASVLLNRA